MPYALPARARRALILLPLTLALLVAGTLGPAVAQARFGDRVLRQGSHGPDVRTLQRVLTQVGPHVRHSGKFGRRTRRNVRRFERRHHWRVDGIVTRRDARGLRRIARRTAAHTANRTKAGRGKPPGPTANTPSPTPSSTSTSTATSSDGLGFAVGGNIQNEDDTTLARDLDTIKSARAGWVRIDINWAVVQDGGPKSYNWAPFDRVVAAARGRGLKVLGGILYTPGWARPSGTSATYGPDPAAYSAFAKTVVRRYAAQGVHAYEVWNEPNTANFWTPKPSPSSYAALLKAAYPAIKAADPQATVITGGTAPSPTNGTSYSPVDFLKAVYAAGGGGSFDAVGHHPYCAPALPGDAQSWSAWYQMYGTSPSLRSTMIANGDSAKKIWATEAGAPTNGPAGSFVSEALQTATVRKAVSLFRSYDWAGPLMWYAARDQGTSTDTRENFYGIVRNDFSPKAAFAAYQAAATTGG